MKVTIEFEIGETTCSPRYGVLCKWQVEFPDGNGVLCSWFDEELQAHEEGEKAGWIARCPQCLKKWSPGTKPPPIKGLTPRQWQAQSIYPPNRNK